MIAEEEAKTKWCPEVRSENPGDCLCIASACMAWRWVQPSPEPVSLHEALVPRGYCGKAGKP